MKSGISAAVMAWCAIMACAEDPKAAEVAGEYVTYEAFGAVGDGVADDLPAICKAHAHANEHKKPVRSKPGATYHLGGRKMTAIIATDTDWGNSCFIIDDSGKVEDHKCSLFEVVSTLKPVDVRIERLEKDQKRLDVKPPVDCLVYVQNRERKVFIRRGLNQNKGTAQQEVFILRKDGSIEGTINWDYDKITQVKAWPIDPVKLTLHGGIFTNIANRMRQEVGYNYWSRNISIRRSNTLVDGITMRVTGETDVGHPYGGFLNIGSCADITLRNCSIDARKTYKTIGAAGKPVSMGSYGYSAGNVVNFRMINCRMNDINDGRRWGVIGSNFMKNILLEECVLSRMDVHQGVSGDYIIRRSTLGHAGLNAIGRGRLIVEDSTLYGRSLITFRSDYGSTWEGEVVIRNSRWIPCAGGKTPARNVIFSMHNDGRHDFGYPCYMPREITIDGLVIDDSRHPEKYQGVVFFDDPIGGTRENRPFAYVNLPEILRVRNLKTASGLPPRVSSNPELAKAIKLIEKE